MFLNIDTVHKVSELKAWTYSDEWISCACHIFYFSARTALQKTFDYCHQTIGFSHATIMKFPRILRYPYYHVQQRHEFLKSIGRDQYDPEKPNYVSLDALVMANDVVFCRKVAKCSISQYNQFLKTRWIKLIFSFDSRLGVRQMAAILKLKLVEVLEVICLVEFAAKSKYLNDNMEVCCTHERCQFAFKWGKI